MLLSPNSALESIIYLPKSFNGLWEDWTQSFSASDSKQAQSWNSSLLQRRKEQELTPFLFPIH